MPVTITDISKLFSIKVYTCTGHLCLLAGSKNEAVIVANILFTSESVYKIQVFDQRGNKQYELV